MKTRRRAATVLLGMVAVLAVGCSDDSENAAASRDTVTLDQWVEQFDRACIAASRSLSDVAPSMNDAEFAAFNEGAFTILGALKPPDDKATPQQGWWITCIAHSSPDSTRTNSPLSSSGSLKR
jgi:hypothetical protein